MNNNYNHVYHNIINVSLMTIVWLFFFLHFKGPWVYKSCSGVFKTLVTRFFFFFTSQTCVIYEIIRFCKHNLQSSSRFIAGGMTRIILLYLEHGDGTGDRIQNQNAFYFITCAQMLLRSLYSVGREILERYSCLYAVRL